MEEAVSEEYKKELREQMLAFKKQKEEEFTRKEREWQQQASNREMENLKKFQEEKMKLQQDMEEQLRKSITADYENRVRIMEQNLLENEEKLKKARQAEYDFLQKEKDLLNREAEMEIAVQRKMLEERNKLFEEFRKQEEQKLATRDSEYQLKVKELEKQLEDQKKLAEEMRRKAEQGSMQLQGEVQELALEELLKQAFPMDSIAEVGKGVRGADCIQTVRNSMGQDCGKIIYESKRTKDFNRQWIEKLKADMRSTAADVAVIVSQALPDGQQNFGQVEGVWICSFQEIAALAHVLRDGILKISAVARSQENKGDKMHLLYGYLTSNEFSEQWKAIREGFMSMRLSIQKERDAMEKLWKAREKQLEKVLLNAAHIKGSIEGIAGQDSIDMNLLEDGAEEDLPE
jgi:hypothetical protein